MFCLDVLNLHKNYGSLEAVRGVSFRVRSGTCFGLLGPNGAGKSTIIEILEGIKDFTQGEILFHQKPRSAQYKEKIGIQFQSTALQDYMRVGEALEVFASFYQAPISIDHVIKICQLEEILDRDHRHLSGGQRKRLLLGLSLINNPELIFLDEPTTGLDPSSRKMFWQLIENIKKEGRTIILTTHYMDEAYFLCDEMIIVDRGKILVEGTPKNLLQQHFQGTRVVFPLSYNTCFSPIPKIHSWREIEGKIEFQTQNLQALLKDFMACNIPLKDMEVHPYTLDDLFLHLTGKTLHDDESI